MEQVKLADIRPASYNPRHLSDQAFAKLKESLQALGVIKPIIVRRENMTIVAGHQRTKAMAAIGMTEAPAFILDGVTLTDEVRFNQMHNACDYEVNPEAPQVRIDPAANLQPGWNRVHPKHILVTKLGRMASVNFNLGALILKYGTFGSAVCDDEGVVIISGAYAAASRNANKWTWIYRLPTVKREVALHYFGQQYGVFSYDHIERKTYVQSQAQMLRCRQLDEDRKDNKSTLYERHVLPYLKAHPSGSMLRVLDFGAGQKDYAKKLSGLGFDITALEFYHRHGSDLSIDVDQVERDIAKVLTDLRTVGPYDVVVCDSVINSVDTVEAELSVLRSISALCKLGGQVFWSGRSADFADRVMLTMKTTSRLKNGQIRFSDAHGFTALFREGNWFFQLYHTAPRVFALNRAHIGQAFTVSNIGTAIAEGDLMTGSSFQVHAVNERPCSDDELRAALRFEFSLPLPGGQRYGHGDHAADAFTSSLAH